MAKQNIGLIGLAVMGENLVLNMEDHGFSVAVFNRTTNKVDDFINTRAKGKNIKGCHSIEELMDSLEKPRKVMLMVKAGKPVDDFIELLIPHLDRGDIVIDGGNSNYKDSIRRGAALKEKGLHFVDVGTSGGVWGLTEGYSMMV
ncbi:MAG: NADP-dependent phosphogluconate dehydrogenase, partial [Desulfobacterales bacterium]|nr:NADP-dependent phosphogluconate dehydrogenase [Desulfobacterales bacterium]